MKTKASKRLSLAGFTWLLLTGMVPAAPAGEPPSDSAGHTFLDAIQTLRSNHPALSAARAQTAAARSRVGFADALPDPTLSVGHYVESVQTRTGPQETVISLSQSIPWFGVRREKSTAANATAEHLESKEHQLGLQLGRALADAFYEYAYIGQATRLTEENLRLLRDLEPIVETRVAAGANLNALLRLKVESGKLADQLKSLAARRIERSATLNALLNEPEQPLRPWPEWTTPATNAFDLSELTLELTGHHPALSAQDHQIDVLESRERSAKLEGYPTIALGANYIQVGSPEVNPSTPDAGEDPWGIQASIRIPLWRGPQKAKQAEASHLRRVEEHRREDLATMLIAELEQHVSLHADAIRRLNVYGEELLGLARQAVENSRAGYENGNTTVLELIDSERSLLALELEYWRAVADAHIHHTHILSLTRPGLDALIASQESP